MAKTAGSARIGGNYFVIRFGYLEVTCSWAMTEVKAMSGVEQHMHYTQPAAWNEMRNLI